MILPNSNDVLNAAQVLSDAINFGASNVAGRMSDARAAFSAIRADMVRVVDTALRTTATGADLAAFFTARGIADGQVFVLQSTADTTDTAFAGEKGEAPANGDVFVRDGSVVLYRGTTADVANNLADAVTTFVG